MSLTTGEVLDGLTSEWLSQERPIYSFMYNLLGWALNLRFAVITIEQLFSIMKT